MSKVAQRGIGMSVFSHPEFHEHEQVSFFHDEKTGLKAIISFHNTHLGPALGGCRMWNYESDEQALRDVLRLSRGMTYKAAITGLPLGGGKSVIIGDPKKIKTAELMKAIRSSISTWILSIATGPIRAQRYRARRSSRTSTS